MYNINFKQNRYYVICFYIRGHEGVPINNKYILYKLLINKLIN